MTWRIKWEDILSNEKSRQGKRFGSLTSVTRTVRVSN